MRIRISADSATEHQLRSLLEAVSKVGLSGTTTVGLNGPECYSLETAHLTPRQFALIVSEIVVGPDDQPLARTFEQEAGA